MLSPYFIGVLRGTSPDLIATTPGIRSINLPCGSLLDEPLPSLPCRNDRMHPAATLVTVPQRPHAPGVRRGHLPAARVAVNIESDGPAVPIPAATTGIARRKILLTTEKHTTMTTTY